MLAIAVHEFAVGPNPERGGHSTREAWEMDLVFHVRLSTWDVIDEVSDWIKAAVPSLEFATAAMTALARQREHRLAPQVCGLPYLEDRAPDHHNDIHNGHYGGDPIQ
jgi:hypothetical protein